MPGFDHLTEACLGAHGGFDAFAVRLPEADIVEQLVNVVVKPLFALLGAPNFDAVLDEPFHNERRFVCDSADTVEHEHQQDIEFLFQRKLFDCL